jgi:hypothetical protein
MTHEQFVNFKLTLWMLGAAKAEKHTLLGCVYDKKLRELLGAIARICEGALIEETRAQKAISAISLHCFLAGKHARHLHSFTHTDFNIAIAITHLEKNGTLHPEIAYEKAIYRLKRNQSAKDWLDEFVSLRERLMASPSPFDNRPPVSIQRPIDLDN